MIIIIYFLRFIETVHVVVFLLKSYNTILHVIRGGIHELFQKVTFLCCNGICIAKYNIRSDLNAKDEYLDIFVSF